MTRRLERTLEQAGLPPVAIAPVLENHERAMVVRRRRLDDDHHPAFLHPGRTVLVAVTDAELRDPGLLRLGPLLDSLRPDLAPDASRVESPSSSLASPAEEGSTPVARTDFEARHALAPLPFSGLAPVADGPPPPLDLLMEHLVTLEDGELGLVLSEALDHLRHLHLESDAALRARVAERAGALLLPLASRAGGTLDRRYRWWWRRVGRGMTAGEPE